ncbi:MAG: T9SS type A sorting domain-containing protein [Ignavibacteriales bacterium]|nr:T9SS type A sorting domain-containing protein [Ignavibacteriales bacterium]
MNQIIYTVTSGSTIDTLKGANRGLGVDENGNILYVQSGPSKVIKINSTTFEGMGSRVITDDIGSSPTAPSVDENGTIFIGPVVGGGSTAIAMYDTDLQYLGNAVVGPPAISRTLIVSKDGNTIYWMPFTATTTYVYSRADEFSAYELADSMFIGMSIETTAWQPGTGNLWVSNDSRGTDSTKSHLTWYSYDLTASAFVDSFSLPVTGQSDEWPRGLAFSPDGKLAYVGLFGTAFDRIYKFTNDIPDSIDLSITYEADMELEILKGTFNPATDTVEVRGAYFGWGSEAPDMEPSAVNPNKYTHTETQRATVGDNIPNYKFYYTPGNWEGGSDKTYRITQADYDNGYAVVSRPFNDATLDDVINQDCTILFVVDTDSALSSINNTMFTTVNTVHITGASSPLKWPDGGWPDAQLDRMIPMFDDGTNGDEVSGDGIFSANVTFPKYSSFRIQYKYGINYGDAANNQGGNDNENGVGADHFITLTKDLSSAKVENKFGVMGDHTLLDMVTGVEVLKQLPTGFELTQNYPNPFNPTTKINFQIPSAQNVSLKVYNLLGQEVATLLNEQMGAGVYEVGFDASQLSSGVYIYSLKAGSFVASKKMTLVK